MIVTCLFLFLALVFMDSQLYQVKVSTCIYLYLCTNIIIMGLSIRTPPSQYVCVYLTTPEMRTPHYSGHFNLSQCMYVCCITLGLEIKYFIHVYTCVWHDIMYIRRMYGMCVSVITINYYRD